MDVDMVLTIGGIVLGINAPFYIMQFNTYKMLIWIRTHCTECREHDPSEGIPSL